MNENLTEVNHNISQDSVMLAMRDVIDYFLVRHISKV